MTLSIAPVDDPLSAEDDAFATNEDTPVRGDLLANDIVGDNGPPSAAGLEAPESGTLDLAEGGTFTDAPAENASGEESLTAR